MVPPLLKQIFICLGPWLHIAHIMFIYGLQYIMILNLRSPDSKLKLTMDEESWIPSTLILMSFPSTFLAGLFTPKYGRKKIFLIFLGFHFIGTVTIFYAQDFKSLFCGFTFIGFGNASNPISTVYIAECCSPKIRGTLLDVKSFFMFVSLSFARLIGNFMNYRYMALFSTIIPFIALVLFTFCPESPPWLVSQGRFEEARKTFEWIRGFDETDEIEKLIKHQSDIIVINRSNKKSLKMVMSEFCDKGFMKANSVIIASVVFFDCCGKQLVTSYIDTINAITNDPQHALYYTLALDVSDFLALCISTVLLTIMSRRRLLFLAGVPAVVWVLFFSAVTYISSLGRLPERLFWLPFTMILIYFFMINISVLPIIMTIQGEVYPLSHRGAGVVFQSFIFVASTFFVTKTGLHCLKYFALHGTFLIYAVGMSVSLLYLYFMLPETFHQTLQDIENVLSEIIVQDNNTSDAEVNEKMLTEAY